MFKVILAITALLAVAQCGLRPADNFLPATTNGKVTFSFIPGAGYAIPVDFAKGSKVNSFMVVNLYQSNIIFTESCFNFKKYPCSQFDHCKQDKTRTVNNDLLNVTMQIRPVDTLAWVDYTYYAVSSGAPAGIAVECKGPYNQPYGNNAFGFVGLGFNAGAAKNFLNGISQFSVYFFQNAFRLDFTPQSRPDVIAKIRTDGDWRIPAINNIVFNGAKYPLPNPSAIFDINSDNIGVPADIYQKIVEQMKVYGAQCQLGQPTTPDCVYAGELSSLPVIGLDVNGQGTIPLTYKNYVTGFSNGKFKLNFKALGPSLPGVNYVNAKYQNTFVLGNTVLGYYFTTFNMKDSAISLHNPLQE